MKWVEAWRLFERGELPKTLMHAYGSDRVLGLDMILVAHQKIVSNPGTSKYKYRAGFHVGLTEEGVVNYLKNFKRKDLVVCRVEVAKIRPKPRSPHGIYLAKYMRINSRDWKHAQTQKST